MENKWNLMEEMEINGNKWEINGKYMEFNGNKWK